MGIVQSLNTSGNTSAIFTNNERIGLTWQNCEDIMSMLNN